jgi:hypothetical protein
LLYFTVNGSLARFHFVVNVIDILLSVDFTFQKKKSFL